MVAKKRWLLFVLVALLVIVGGIGLYIVQKTRQEAGLRTALNNFQYSPANFVVTNNTVFFLCKADFDHIQKGSVELPMGLFLRRWVNCYFFDKKNKEQVITLPLFVEKYQTQVSFTSLALAAASGLDRPISDLDIDQIIANAMNILGGGYGIRTVTVAIGSDSNTLLKGKNPLQATLDDGLGSQMMAFGQSGNITELPTFKKLDHPLVLPYRVEFQK